MTYLPPRSRRIPPDAYDFIVWSMDEAASPVLNAGRAVPLPLTGSGTFQSTGLFGTSVGFRTTGLTTGDSAVEPNPYSLTFSAWVMLRSYGSGSPQIIIKSWHTVSEGWSSPFGIGIVLHGSGGGAWDVGGPTGGVSITTADPVLLGTWTHLAFTWDGFYVRAYKNGVLAGSNHVNMTGSPVAFDFGHHGPYQVGQNVITTGDQVDGWIDDVRICSIARSPTYLEQQYRWGIGQFDVVP
jgi:hypothetical protein